jgi:hypothetical protein
MSEPIKKDELVEEGVLDNILKPLDLLKKSLAETDAELKKFAETVKTDLSFSEKSKDLREFATEEDKLTKVYERKKKVQDEQLKISEEERKLRAQLKQLQSEEAKNLAALKAQIAAQNKELRATATAVQNNTTAYKELERTTIAAKNQSKELGAQLLVLANAGKQNTTEYAQLSAQYTEATAKAAALDKQLKGLDKSVGDNQRNVGNYKSAFEDLDARVASGTMTMREMTKAIKEYQTIALQNADIPEVYQMATAKAGELTDKVGDLRAETKALSSDTINLDAAMSLANGIAGVGQAYAGLQALGVENDEVLRSVQKLTAIQSIMNGLKAVEQTLNKSNIVLLKQTTVYQKAAAGAQMLYAAATGGATAATKAFRLALIATGIGALVVGIGLLVANWDKFANSVKKSVDAFKALTESSAFLRSILNGVLTVMQALGLAQTDAEKAADAAAKKQYELSVARKKQVDAAIKDNKRLRDTIEKSYDFEIAMAKAAGKDVFELEQQKRAELIQTYKTDIKLKMAAARLEAGNVQKLIETRNKIIETLEIIDNLEKDIAIANKQRQTEQTNKSKEHAEQLKKAHDERLKMFQEQEDRQKKYMEDLQKDHEQTLKNIGDERKMFVDKIQAMNEIIRIHTETVEEANRRELLSIQVKYRNLKAEAINNGFEISEIEQAERLERESAEKKHLEALLRVHETELDKKQMELKKQNLETISDDTAFKEAEKQREIQHLQDLIGLRKQAGQDVLDLEIKLLEMQRKTTEKAYSQSVENIANKVADLYAKSADRAIESMKRQQDAAAAMMNHFAGLSENGNIEATQSMAAMIERQEEFQRKQEQLERRKLRIQRASQAGAILAKELESGKSVPEALASMGAFLAASEGLIPSFDVGTENTGSGYGYGIDGKGGFAAILHPNEKVLNAKHTQMVGDLSNQELAELGYKSRMGMLENGNSSHDLMVLHNELKNIKKAIENQPQQIVGLEETLSGLVKLTVSTKKGSHINSTQYRS